MVEVHVAGCAANLGAMDTVTIALGHAHAPGLDWRSEIRVARARLDLRAGTEQRGRARGAPVEAAGLVA